MDLMAIETLNMDHLAGILVGGILTIGIFGAIFDFIMSILSIVASWKIFNKLGEPGWKCLIPFYGTYVQYKYTWKPTMAIPMWVLTIAGSVVQGIAEENSVLMLVASLLILAAWIIAIKGYHNLSKAFGHGVGYTIGLALFTSIFMIILGFGKSAYQGNPTESKY